MRTRQSISSTYKFEIPGSTVTSTSDKVEGLSALPSIVELSTSNMDKTD